MGGSLPSSSAGDALRLVHQVLQTASFLNYLGTDDDAKTSTIETTSLTGEYRDFTAAAVRMNLNEASDGKDTQLTWSITGLASQSLLHNQGRECQLEFRPLFNASLSTDIPLL